MDITINDRPCPATVDGYRRLCMVTLCTDYHAAIHMVMTWLLRGSEDDPHAGYKAKAAQLFLDKRFSKEVAQERGYTFCQCCGLPRLDRDDTDQFHVGCKATMMHACHIGKHTYCMDDFHHVYARRSWRGCPA